MKRLSGIIFFVLLVFPAFNFACTISCYFRYHEETLFDAVYYSDVSFIKVYHGDINATNKNGLTALMFASQRGQAAVVRAIIAAKTDINEAAKDGKTALSIAKQGGNEIIIDLLRKAGAK